MNQIIDINANRDFVISCPECGCQLWYIVVDKPDLDSTIQKYACSDPECEFEFELMDIAMEKGG